MNSDTEFVIETKDLCKTYRSGFFRNRKFQALNGVSLQVRRGQVYGLLGPNGAGKTTLIKILLGIVRRTGGDAQVLGLPAGSIGARRQVGYLPENHRIPRHLTANTALEYYGSLSGMSSSEIRQRRVPLLTQVGLAGRVTERVSGYSKGMLQRLGLAQAILHKPQLVVLDEPTDGVDPVGRKEIRDVLRTLAADGHTIFLNSHLLQEIELVCDSVAILNKGKVLAAGSVRDLTRSLSDTPVQFQLQGDPTRIRSCFAHLPAATFRDVAADAVEAEARITKQADIDLVIDELRKAGVSLWKMARREQTLEEVFMQVVEGASR